MEVGLDGDCHGEKQVVKQIQRNRYSNTVHKGVADEHDNEPDVFQGQGPALAYYADQMTYFRRKPESEDRVDQCQKHHVPNRETKFLD